MNPSRFSILVSTGPCCDPDALSEHLLAEGHCVYTTQSGTETVQRCGFDPPDVLIVDAQLSDMDGFEVCERVRHEAGNNDLTIIVIADALDDMTHNYLGQMVEYAGGDYFLAKPCDLRLLMSLLHELATSDTNGRNRLEQRHPTKVTWPTPAVTGRPLAPLDHAHLPRSHRRNRDRQPVRNHPHLLRQGILPTTTPRPPPPTLARAQCRYRTPTRP